MERELKMPDFLQEDADTIHNRMLENAPLDINLVEGDFFWDATRPTAEEKAELLQIKLQNILKLAFPQTSYGQYLDFLGEFKDVYRNPPTKATGYIKVTGSIGAYMPKDTIIYTESYDGPSIGFVVLESTEVDENGEAMVKVECTEPGVIGNVASNTIKIPEKDIPGIKTITNPESLTGGTGEEDDEAFRERVLAAYDESLSGSDSDYKRWALQVPGVGQAYVISEWEGFGTGTTKLLIMDSNGQPANETLISQVQEYIAPLVEKNRGGLAPVNANVTVSAPDVIIINISVSLIFKDGYENSAVIENLKENIKEYLSTIEITTDDENAEYVYKEAIGHVILSTPGVKIYSNLTINGGTDPILVPLGEVPALGEVSIL
jgi:uncharacterized phage protein gp47/JayE